jgi:hypothetical protein
VRSWEKDTPPAVTVQGDAAEERGEKLVEVEKSVENMEKGVKKLNVGGRRIRK